MNKSGSAEFFAGVMRQDSGTLGVGLFQAALDRMIQPSGLSVFTRFLQASGIRSKKAILVGYNEGPSLAQGEDVKSRI